MSVGPSTTTASTAPPVRKYTHVERTVILSKISPRRLLGTTLGLWSLPAMRSRARSSSLSPSVSPVSCSSYGGCGQRGVTG